MKTFYKLLVVILCIITTTQSCSRKKNNFISRNYHAVTTEFNILYNGGIALERGKANLNDQYTENFWELLPVERIEVINEFFTSNTEKAENQDFRTAEDKAIKAIQKHGMNIDGREKNPQIDEAYLLLGKARYYNQRFVPAMAAFNNILNKYPTSDKINQVKIWREKTNMRLYNSEVAIQRLKRLLTEEKLEDQELADATATLAQAYINIKSKDSALAQLHTASIYTKNKSEKARYHFIRGQIYNELKEKDSANMEYDVIIEMHRKIPRSYYINAHLQKSFNFDSENGDTEAFEAYLKALEENRENRPFLDKIYYRIAEYHRENKSDSLSEVYYNKSLRKTTSDKHLKALNYETLANMYFDKYEYKTAGFYYDSTLTNMVEKTRPYRAIKKKLDNLKDVIYYEEIAKENDSILNIINLSKEAQVAFYQKHIEDLKAKAQKEAEKKEAEKRLEKNRKLNNRNFSQSKESFSLNPGQKKDMGFDSGNTRSSFYFYNSTSVAYGKNEFLRLWGKRNLADNWRLSEGIVKNEISQEKETQSTEKETQENKLYETDYYISKLPTDPDEIEDIKTERNFAYFQLGGIYKEKFKIYELAKSKYENLLESNPEERLILPSKYNLYRIYDILGLTAKKEAIKADIINNHPDTRYAEILSNPNADLSKYENSPEAIYTKLYKQFEAQEYKEVISQAKTQILRLEGDPIVPKFEILKASAKGRLYGFDAYKEGINFIALNYPNSEEGKKALKIRSNSFPIFEKQEFIQNTEAKHFNVVYIFINDNNEDIDAFKKVLDEELEKIKYFKLHSSIDVYDEATTLVVVHGLKSYTGALGFGELLNAQNKDEDGNILPPKINRDYFSIASPNYAIVQRHKNLQNYLQPK